MSDESDPDTEMIDQQEDHSSRQKGIFDDEVDEKSDSSEAENEESDSNCTSDRETKLPQNRGFHILPPSKSMITYEDIIKSDLELWVFKVPYDFQVI